MQPTPFTTFERLTDRLGRCRAGYKQHEVGIERGCRLGSNDFERLAAFQVRLKAAYPPNRERLQAAWGESGGNRLLTHSATQEPAFQRQEGREQKRHLLAEQIILFRPLGGRSR